MNRRERRQTEKYLGLTKHYKSLSRKEKFDMMAERIKLGKERHTENVEKIRTVLSEQQEVIDSKRIFTIAECIAKVKGVPVTDVMEEAKKEYESYKKN